MPGRDLADDEGAAAEEDHRDNSTAAEADDPVDKIGAAGNKKQAWQVL